MRVLPQVVEAAAPRSAAIDKMTVISTDGASSLTKSVACNVAQGLQLGTDLTGIDLAKLLARLGGAAERRPGRSNGHKVARSRPSTVSRHRKGPDLERRLVAVS